MNLENNTTRHLLRYRAWNRDDGTLYTWNILEDYPLKNINSTFPQEFTGLYDKNLNSIYLGDIVHYLGDNYLVRFLDGGYILYKLENLSTLKFWWFHTDIDKFGEMEVVGNTFEHAAYLVECLNKENEFEMGLTNP